MSPLAPESRSSLLRHARLAVDHAVAGRPLEPVDWQGELAQPRGVFVTLRYRGHLRGCIGQVEPEQALGLAMVHCAIAAATEDPRFPRIAREELPEIEIEISVLSALRPIRPEEIQIGAHGLLVARGYRRGLLLPQVARERGWSTKRFLEETCQKAGLDRDAWKQPETSIQAFEAEVFSDRDVAVDRCRETATG